MEIRESTALPKDVFDKYFICSIIKENDVATALREQMSANWLSKPYNEMFQYLCDFFIQYGKAPSVETFQDRWGSAYENPPETLLHYCDRIKNRQKYNRFLELARTIQEKTAAARGGGYKDKEDLLPSLEKIVFEFAERFATELSNNQTVDLTENTMLRYQELLQRSDPARMKETYCPTPWKPINDEINGWESGDFVTILGKSGLGKTWALLLFLLTAYNHGRKVLLFTQEMTIRQLGSRFDSLLTGIPHKSLSKGRLDKYEEELFKNHLQNLEYQKAAGKLPGFLINFGSAEGGVDLVSAVIRAVKPDIVGIDGAYLFSSNYSWDKMGELTKGIKSAAIRNQIPILVTNQVASKSATTIAANSPTFYNDATNVVYLEQDKAQRANNQMTIRMPKMRDGSQADLEFPVSWNFEFMDFRYLEELAEAREEAIARIDKNVVNAGNQNAK